jgi:NAD(P)-dependent dehydrogenase (short-subunit alcohol dehydrogenase family)
MLDGKVSIITGGAGSVGLASARAFVREGAKVMLVDLREAICSAPRRRWTAPTSRRTRPT